jgi:hypothetical protein
MMPIEGACPRYFAQPTPAYLTIHELTVRWHTLTTVRSIFLAGDGCLFHKLRRRPETGVCRPDPNDSWPKTSKRRPEHS